MCTEFSCQVPPTLLQFEKANLSAEKSWMALDKNNWGREDQREDSVF